MRKGSSRKSASEHEGRYLVANRTARALIEKQRGNGCEWVFCGRSGRRLQRFNTTAWRKARGRAGLNVRWHDLRHTYGERLAAAGVPWEYRKVLLGHRIPDVTAHYSAPGLAQLVEMADRVSRESAPSLRPVRSVHQNGAVPLPYPESRRR